MTPGRIRDPYQTDVPIEEEAKRLDPYGDVPEGDGWMVIDSSSSPLPEVLSRMGWKKRIGHISLMSLV